MNIRIPVLLAAFIAMNTASADDNMVRQDARALEVIKSMSAFTTALDRAVVEGITLADAGLGAGLVVTNSSESTMTFERPGSLRMSRFDGVNQNDLYFHDGQFTVIGSEHNYYAQADLPKNIDAALEFALEELSVELPLVELVYQNASETLINSGAAIIYLTDKARVDGVDCHHIVIRDAEVDYQLWVQEGDKPLPRKITMTNKWVGGAPRFSAQMTWNLTAEIDPETFVFTPPEGAINIGFAKHIESGGE